MTLDRETGTGQLGWFSQLGITHTQTFTLPPDTSGELTLAGDRGVIAVLLGGRRVTTVSDATLQDPHQRRVRDLRRPGQLRRGRHHCHDLLTAVLADAVALACLAVLLATAVLHLPWRREAAVAVAATVVVLATGLVDLAAFEDTVRALLPVVVFLVTILVVSDVCARAGLFAAAARVVGGASRRPARTGCWSACSCSRLSSPWCSASTPPWCC